ncbi:MAG TPA: hypothetical protein VLM89_01995 [Phycisphaerae bacterium]|nr:hypothetical protein [Phycisphaerae bacterium]
MDRPKVGILGLTLEFYEQYAPALRAGRERFVREKLMPALADVADVRFDGAVFTAEAVEKIIRQYEVDGVEVLLVILLTYSPSLVSGPALKRTRLPIVVWNVQELWAVDEKYGDQELVDNHGVHGTHDLCNVLNRSEVPYAYVTNHWNDADAIPRLNELLRAGHTVSRLRRARLGLLGYPFPGMGDFGLDTTHMASTLGCQWQSIALSDFHRRAADTHDTDIKKLVSEYRTLYEVGINVGEDDLKAAARAEIALRGIVRDQRLDAYSYQFLAFGEDDRTETLPFVAASRLLGEGIGFGGEGDLISAAGSALLNRLAPPASFSEIFTIDFAGNAVLLSHMGEASVGFARKDQRIRLVRRPAPIVPIRGNQLALVFGFEPGPATLMALTLGARRRWRIIAAPITIESFGPLEHMAVPHAKARPAGNVRDFLTAYAEAGGPHHLAVCKGDARGRLAAVARFLDADYVEI